MGNFTEFARLENLCSASIFVGVIKSALFMVVLSFDFTRINLESIYLKVLIERLLVFLGVCLLGLRMSLLFIWRKDFDIIS